MTATTTPPPRPVVEKVTKKAAPKKAGATKSTANKAAAKRGPKCLVCHSQDDVQKFTIAGRDTRPLCAGCRAKLGG